jgi:hypothetical protein
VEQHYYTKLRLDPLGKEYDDEMLTFMVVAKQSLCFRLTV